MRRLIAAGLLALSMGAPAWAGSIKLPVVTRGYATVQPKRPRPAEHLYVADPSKLGHDEQVLLASLQGIVNRSKPRIYLFWTADDRFWFDDLRRRKLTGTPIVVKDPMSLVSMFRKDIEGAVLSDPRVYVSPCVAVDFAGLKNEVIATPALASRLRLPIKTDLRGRFKNDADALRYARTSLLPHLNPYLSLCIDPTILGSQVDDVIAARGSCFWVTGPKAQDRPGANEQAELAEVKAMFAAMPLGSVVRGFWWHGDGMGLD